MNCYDICIRKQNKFGGDIWYGWARNKQNQRFQHCWIVKDGIIWDPFGWANHEPMGIRKEEPIDENLITVSRKSGSVGGN